VEDYLVLVEYMMLKDLKQELALADMTVNWQLVEATIQVKTHPLALGPRQSQSEAIQPVLLLYLHVGNLFCHSMK